MEQARHQSQRPTRASRTAFTLVEVLLALGIGSALLVFAILFYRQAAELRNQILLESDRLSTMRLVMDRIASDLRTAQGISGRDDAFSGGSNWVSFIRLTMPNGPAAVRAGTILSRISYAGVPQAGGTNAGVAGLSRSEASPDAPRANEIDSLRPSTNSPALSEEVAVDGSAGKVPAAPADRNLMTDLIRQLRFRYWDGASWLEGWTNALPPSGVEVVISSEAPAEEAPFENTGGSSGTGSSSGSALGSGAAESSGETGATFRRVIYIPTGWVARHAPGDASAGAGNGTGTVQTLTP